MLSLDEEKIPSVRTPSSRNRHVMNDEPSAVTSSSPSPVQPAMNTLETTDEDVEDDDSLMKSCGWGMWLVHEVSAFLLYDSLEDAFSLSHLITLTINIFLLIKWSIENLCQEVNPSVWVNVNDILHFLPPDDGAHEAAGTSSTSSANSAPTADSSSESERFQPKDDRISFVWASERTGFNHLYLVTARIPQVSSFLQIINRGRLEAELKSFNLQRFTGSNQFKHHQSMKT